MHDGHHRGGGRGHHHHDHSPDMAQRHKRDQAVFHELLRRHDAIRREVENIENGIRAVTESDDPEIAGILRAHMEEMERRWCDEPVPALDGKTPRECAADPTRREALERLLRSFEHRADRLPDGADTFDVARLRALLDL